MKLLREVVEPQLVELRDPLLERHDVVAAERLQARFGGVDADARRAVQVEPLRRVEGLLWAGALLQRRQRRRRRGREVRRGPLVRLAHVEQDRVAAGEGSFTNGKTLEEYMGPGGDYELPENYIRESILNPGKVIRENYANVMPNNFASQLKPRQVEALVLMMKHLDRLADEGWIDENGKVQKPEAPPADSSAAADPARTGEGG